MNGNKIDGLVRAAAADELMTAGDLAMRLRVLRDMLYLASDHGRETMPELVSAHWLAQRLYDDVDAALGAGQGQSLEEALS